MKKNFNLAVLKKLLPLLPLLWILFAGFLGILDLFHPGFAVTHDGQDHIARIANFYINLQQGIFIPRWAPNLNWGYGHPVIEFLYPLPSYIASFFHAVGFSLIDATKIVYALGLALSGVSMYIFISTLWGMEAGLVGGILYMFGPYRFVDLYVRGDIGEHVAFVFIPLVLYFIYKVALAGKVRDILLGGVSLALLILSHNAVSLIFVPLILLYGLYLSYSSQNRKKVFLHLGITILFGFLFAAFFWVPALIEGKYTLRNIVTKGGYKTSFVDLPGLLYGPWSYGGTNQFTVQLGIVQWIGLILAPFFTFFLWKKKKKEWLLSGGLLLYTLIAIFIMLPQSQFIWERLLLLQNFQFPWRFLAIPVFTLAFLTALIVGKMPHKVKVPLSVGIFIVVLLLSTNYWHAKAYMTKPESFFTGIYDSTTDTGESAPIWSVRFMEKRPNSHIEVISGAATITETKRSATMHSYIVDATKSASLRENTIYFLGWKALVDGVSVPIQFQDPTNRGVITFDVPQGRHMVSVVYEESKMRLLGDGLTVFGVIAAIGYSLYSMKKRNV